MSGQLRIKARWSAIFAAQGFIYHTILSGAPADALSAAWREQPPPDALKVIGDAFVREEEALALRLPSVIVPDEANYLLNAAHPRFGGGEDFGGGVAGV